MPRQQTQKRLNDEDSVKLGLVTRSLEIRGDEIDADNRTIELTFSSEDPYERWFGIEILSHDSKHVDMGFIASGNAPLLADHNHGDQIGVIEKAWLQDGVGHARVRFGKSNRASEFFQDVQDGIRKNVSVGYYVNEMKLQQERDDGPDVFLVTRWKPVEASLVSVPADETVGVRSSDDEVETTILRTRKVEEMTTQTTETKTAEDSKAEVKPQPVDMDAIRKAERSRQADIIAMGKMSGLEKEADEAIQNDVSVDSFRAKAFDAMVEKNAKPAVDMSTLSKQDIEDCNRFSFTKAIREAAEGGLSGVEKEMHQEAVQQFRGTGVTVQGTLAIPYQVLAQRDLTAGTDSQGGYTVATNLLASSFIELLQNRMLTRQMGATVLDNLMGDVAIPSQATGATAAWEGENDAGAESSPTFGQVSLTPNRVGTYTEVSKQLLVQSSLSVENIVRQLLADSIALAIDLAALHGSGSGNQPTGIAATAGIGSVAGGTNGLAPTWAHIVELETDVATANADMGRMGYLTNAKVRGKLKTTEKASNTAQFVWTDSEQMNFGMLNGYRAGVSNQVADDLDKGTSTGVCSAIFFGNWADLMLAFWGGLDMVVDPYTLATTNLTRITANTYADVGVRHAGSFSAMLDALTT